MTHGSEQPLRLRGGRVLLPDGALAAADVLVRRGRIAQVAPSGSAAEPRLPGEMLYEVPGCVVAPGFIDTHVHGAAGYSFMDAGPAGLAAVSGHLARHGVTGCLATTVSASAPELLGAVKGLAAASPALGTPGVRLFGIHLEGPFISAAAAGVHRREHLRPPRSAELRRLIAAAGNRLRVVTLAPELDGAADALRLLADHGVTVSVGHSVVSHDAAVATFDAGARRVTHCFNALPPVRARDPGPVAAALGDARVEVEVIADGRHVAAPVLAMVHRIAGVGRMTIASDGSDVAGLPPGQHRRWEGTAVRVSDDGITTLSGGLAGGADGLDRGVRTLVAAGVPLEAALHAASATPARRLGLADAGRIAPGAAADLVVLDPSLQVAMTFIGGHAVYSAC